MSFTTTKNTAISELLRTESANRDIDWLKDSLNAAIELELATLPPYLCAWWSIKDDNETAAKLIRTVLMEEMLHMGLVANMLTTIGGTPKINSVLPSYPGNLPGGIRPQLTVYLAGLSKTYLDEVCKQIEYPESGPIAFFAGETYPTIGAFYDAVLVAFQELKPAMSGTNQLTDDSVGGHKLYAINTLADVEKAITEIKVQGEGTSLSPDAEGFGGELAHYYKFDEISHGRKLIQVDGVWRYAGEVVPFPETYPMAQVPEGGWQNPSPEVSALLNQFNSAFKAVLDELELAWTTGNKDKLSSAIGLMFSLKAPAIQLMQIPLPDGSGNYGPDFLIY
ncbi:ferritin-like protein [Nostoc spongiaeforme FACHB-130]|uniref:Ferritin-like protein n=1 Tax=Nostoc spongiaeforme FACHB-130 TaxID=1357510 RepID=A0ABR8FR52_9NOSO|nr:ferritin-like protein [Nostoc spongiaeforme]MBD2593538.1 ferritin-like protein [Nostoc spongiaeforme FACHB-130]